MSIDHGQIVSCDDEFRCGVAPMVDAHTTPVFEEEFVFTEDLFKQYYLLHLRPHEKSLSAKLLDVAVIMFILWAMIAIPYYVWYTRSSPFFASTDTPSWSSYQHLMADAPWFTYLFYFSGAFTAVYGIWLLWGRRPNWNRARWKIRIEKSFDSIITKRNNSPFDSRIETEINLIELPLVLWPYRYTDTWADNNRYVSFIWNTSHYSNLSPRESYAVPFAVRIYRDRIERGSEDSGYAVAYADLYDVLEHKRFPDVAILRSKEYGETVVLKDGFGEASWDEVKTYIDRMIAEAKQTKRVARRKRLFGR